MATARDFAKRGTSLLEPHSGTIGHDNDDSTDNEHPLSPSCVQCGHKHTVNEGFCPTCGLQRGDTRIWYRCSIVCLWCILGVCFVCVLALLFIVASFVKSVNAQAEKLIEAEGTLLLGVPISVGAVDCDLIHGRLTVWNVSVYSPGGYTAPFLTLERFVFDVSTPSLFAWYTSLQIAPLELEDVELINMSVSIVHVRFVHEFAFIFVRIFVCGFLHGVVQGFALHLT